MPGVSFVKKIYGNPALAKELGEVISPFVKGAPRGAKKEFYSALQAYAKSPTRDGYNRIKSVLLNNRLREIPEEDLISQWGKGQGSFLVEMARIGASMDTSSDMVKIASLMMPVRIRSMVDKEMPKLIQELATKLDSIVVPRIDTEKIVQETMKDLQTEYTTIGKRFLAYPFTKAVSFFVPKSRKALCKGLMTEPRATFAEKYYQRLSSEFGGRAPKEISITNESAGLNVNTLLSGSKSCEGGFNPFHNTIEFTKEMRSMSRATQSGLIEHEFNHWKQSDAIIRTFGVERYIDALRKRTMNILSKEPQYKKCSADELLQIVNKEIINADEIRQAFASSIKAPKIELGSDLGKKAQEYLIATENYVPPKKDFIMTTATKEYLDNVLEKESYAVQKRAMGWTAILENLNLNSL